MGAWGYPDHPDASMESLCLNQILLLREIVLCLRNRWWWCTRSLTLHKYAILSGTDIRLNLSGVSIKFSVLAAL
jgi:hypothetical protein